MNRRPAALVAGSLALLVALAGCASTAAPDAATTPEPAGSPTAEPLTGELVVFAAASLQDAFTELGEQLEQENPGLTVTFSFGGSSTLATQLVSGAPADVFAAASATTMADAAEVTGEPQLFARNTLEIAVPAGNPAGVTGLADLADPDRTIALCAVEVPCGAAAEKAFAAAGLTPAPDTYEKDVTATLTKVQLGEVDAALVYRTDVIGAGASVEGIDFPESAEAVNDYPIALLADAPNPGAAAAFVALVLSASGQDLLAGAGFDPAG
ncbi:molybdate-binding protein [Cellulomonas hominis]|uniref:Molybdate transport system substrate-binding protein n=1 Tax=Cellulomonas hominis TaxID=156981 RepID=A0A511F9I6_9CELL|nr:molybdate ABC transporter substrate-binding protein [Cellulomonas hominis]MBB5472953.1 molybdate transport system substrate-binding protein [Cellulomonas hominis]GEL45910.1 molybdate-binding protein [Cellulomonas hominis]